MAEAGDAWLLARAAGIELLLQTEPELARALERSYSPSSEEGMTATPFDDDDDYMLAAELRFTLTSLHLQAHARCTVPIAVAHALTACTSLHAPHHVHLTCPALHADVALHLHRRSARCAHLPSEAAAAPSTPTASTVPARPHPPQRALRPRLRVACERCARCGTGMRRRWRSG